MEPAGLPAFGANPITVPSLTAIPTAVVTPEVHPPAPDPIEAAPLAVDPLGGDSGELAQAPSAWPFAGARHEMPSELSTADFPVLEIFERDAPEDLADDPLGLAGETAVAEFSAVVASPFELPAEERTAPHPAHGRNELGLDADIAAHWDLWSAQIGRALMPTLRELGRSMQGFSCAMICTADGFNLCTLGVDEAGVLRLAALTSSMHSMADAVTQAVHGDTERRLDLLTLTDQTSTIVVLAIRDLIIGKLLLWVATEDETLGALLVRSRLAAAQVRQLLHVDES